MMKTIQLQVTNAVTVTVLPYSDYEYLMTTKEVALGYGVSAQNIREHQRVNDEFIEGKHFIKGDRISDTLGANAQPHQIFWTKRGVIRLGFFVKSERAKLFRDIAEDLIVNLPQQKDLFGMTVNEPSAAKRKHNRLTQERMISLLADVCRIDDASLRLSILQKLRPNLA